MIITRLLIAVSTVGYVAAQTCSVPVPSGITSALITYSGAIQPIAKNIIRRFAYCTSTEYGGTETYFWNSGITCVNNVPNIDYNQRVNVYPGPLAPIACTDQPGVCPSTVPQAGNSIWMIYGGTVAPALFTIDSAVGSCYKIMYGGSPLYFPASSCKPDCAYIGYPFSVSYNLRISDVNACLPPPSPVPSPSPSPLPVPSPVPSPSPSPLPVPSPSPSPSAPLPTSITVLSPTYSPQTVSNPGFSDVSTLVGGFVRGWYEGVFWRVIGASPNQYVVGGTPSAPVQFSTEGLAQGFANTRVIANVVGYGAMFCRGVGTNSADPEMACVLHNANGVVIDPMFLRGSIGTWSRYNFSTRQITLLRPTRLWDGTVADQGYPDGSWQSEGFTRGFFGSVYWRVVGDPPNHFISGGVPGNPYLYNPRRNQDLGYVGKRQIALVQGYGIMYCRGVGDGGNPAFACIQYDYFGELVNIYAFINEGRLWNALPR